MLTVPRRPPARQRIALGSSTRLSQLHLGSSQLGLNALQCDASDGVICGRAALQKRLRGQSRKLSLPVMSRTETSSIEIGGGLALFAAGGGARSPARSPIGGARSPAAQHDQDQDAGAGCPLLPTAAAAAAAAGDVSSEDPKDPEPESVEAEGAAGGDWPAPPPKQQERTDEEQEAARPADPALQKRIFAGNLPFNASKSRLWDLFEQFGKVENVHIVRAPHTGKSRGFGFVTFRDESGAKNALAADGKRALLLLHRQIRVSPAQPRASAAAGGRGVARGSGGVPGAPGAGPGVSDGPCYMDLLPAELLQLILSHLNLSRLLDAQRVSQRWRDAVRALFRRRHLLDLRAELMAPTLPGGWLGAARFTDHALRHLLRMMPALRVLRTGGAVRTCSYKALDIVATHCKHLVEIDLDGFCINEDSLKRLCLASPTLEEVKLPSHYHFSESSVWVLLRHLPALRTLELNASERVTGRCFTLLPAALRRLSVSGCAGLHSSALLHVGTRCPQLRALDVSGVVHLEPAHVSAALSGCPLLERLTARRLQHPLEKHLPSAGLVGLRHLDVGAATGVTDNTLRQLPLLLPSLHTLNIQECPCVTEEGLLHVRRLKQLLSLDLSYLRCVTDCVLDRLHGLPLKQIHLAEGYLGPATFTEPAVVRLVLACQTLTLLDVSGVEDQLSPAIVDTLFRQLPKSRDVTLYVGGTMLQDLPPPPPGPLRLQDVNTVPMHMRGLVDDLMFGDGDDLDEYDYDDAYGLDDDYYDEYDDDEIEAAHLYFAHGGFDDVYDEYDYDIILL